jgi:hypothetical protein
VRLFRKSAAHTGLAHRKLPEREGHAWQPGPIKAFASNIALLSVFDMPERYAPQSRLVPIAEEVAPWVETIIRL